MSANVPEKLDKQDDPSSNLDTTSFQHKRLGAWDLYTKRDTWSWSTVITSPLGSIGTLSTYRQDLAYVLRTLGDLWAIAGGLIVLYFLALVPNMFLPSIGLWYSGQLIKQVEIAIETRIINPDELFKIIVIKFLCSILQLALDFMTEKTRAMLRLRSRRAYIARVARAISRLDVPTASDAIVQSKLIQLAGPAFTTGSSMQFPSATAAVEVLSQSTTVASTIISIISQVWVLFAVLRAQPDGVALAATTAVRYVFSLLYSQGFLGIANSTWAATTENQAYIRMMGLYNSVCYTKHRQEIYTNNLAAYMSNAFKALQNQLGDINSQPFWDLHEELFDSGATMKQLRAFFETALKELPKGLFMLRAIHTPLSIPVSMASLNVVEQSTSSFLQQFVEMRWHIYQFSASMRTLRVLYEIEVVENTISDGKVPYPENAQNLRSGISIEFRDVSFKYPGKEEYAVRHISFRVEAGQLCVIVGTNGSGKSTLLKLLTRVYDVSEGKILVDGMDIKTLKLHDLHRAMSVLFQDYSHFQLSLRDNIAIGDPENAGDDDRVLEAARLSGVDSIIDKLPEKYDTYLHRPVQDIYNNIPPGVKKLFGRDTTVNAGMGMGSHNKTDTWLSGGQMQKLAVARTFMRSLPDDPRVGLLLFDEPSAHLDPRAEYDLFARLRTLRGEKTMFFSTHRFGNLTRHADLILYMHDSAIIETGTHEQLLERGGQYAELWKIQAQAFM